MSARKRAASKSADAKPRARKPRKKQVRKHVLTPAEREFCAYLAQGVAAREAARLSGLNAKNAGHYLNRPLVQEYLQTLKAEITKEDARRVSEFAQITRTEIIGGLARIATMHPAASRSIHGQVAAYMGLAKIMGMLIDRQMNLDEFFRGWTEEELLAYSTNGTVPARLAASPGQGEAAVGTEPAAQER